MCYWKEDSGEQARWRIWEKKMEGETDDKREKSLVITVDDMLCQFPVGQLTVGALIKNL